MNVPCSPAWPMLISIRYGRDWLRAWILRISPQYRPDGFLLLQNAAYITSMCINQRCRRNPTTLAGDPVRRSIRSSRRPAAILLASLSGTGGLDRYRAVRDDKKGAIPKNVEPILEHLGFNESSWLAGIKLFGRPIFQAIGPADLMRQAAKANHRSWYRGITACLAVFGST